MLFFFLNNVLVFLKNVLFLVSRNKTSNKLKIADQTTNPNPSPTNNQNPTRIASLTENQTISSNVSQISTRFSYECYPYTLEERRAPVSESLINAHQKPSSQPQYNLTDIIYPAKSRNLGQIRQRSQKKSQRITTDKQIIQPRRNRIFTTSKIRFKISFASEPSSFSYPRSETISGTTIF